MNENMPPSPSTDGFTVVAWNVLLHRRYPQADRCKSFADTLNGLNRQLDVVSLSEIEEENGVHRGHEVARLTGNEPGVWEQHNRKRERIGMFGGLVTELVEYIDLGHKKKALFTMVGNVAVTAVHLKYQLYGPERAYQMARVLDRLEEHEYAVVMGDFNSLPCQKPLRMLRSAGFVSAHKQVGESHPRTVPTQKYRADLPWWKRVGSLNGLPIDGIYTKGLEVDDAGSFVGNSDHAGVWAELRFPVQT